MWSNLIPRNPSDHEDDEDVVGDGWDEDDLLEDEEEDDQEIVDIPTPAAVGGMFMGRLTRFIDQVTHAEEEEEFEEEENDPSGDGWDDTDDVDLDLLDEDAAEDETPVPDSQHQQQPFMSNSTTNPPPPQSPAHLTKPSSSTTQSPGGWAVSMMQQGLQAAAAAAAPRPLQEEEEDEDDLVEDTGDGWDQEDDDLDLSEDENMEASEEQPPPSSSAMMNQSLNETVYMDAPQTPLQQQPTTNTTLDESHYVDTVEVSTPSADDAHPFSHLEDYESEVSQPLNTLLHEIREMDEKPATTPGQAVAPALIESNHELDEAPQSSTLSQPEPPVSETSNNTQSMEQQAPSSTSDEVDKGMESSPQDLIHHDATQHTSNHSIPIDDADGPVQNEDEQSSGENSDMEFNHDQAVLAIQEEMQAMKEDDKGEEKKSSVIMVDHTPSVQADNSILADPSLQPQLESEDRTRDTGPPPQNNDNNMNHQLSTDEDVYDDENEDNFGPVVDHLPSTAEKPAPPTSQSLAVNATALEEEFREDDEMDETVDAGSGWADGDDILDDLEEDQEDEDDIEIPLDNTPAVVDHTPLEDTVERADTAFGDPSVLVLQSEGGTIMEDLAEDDENDANPTEYGPVVDHLPTAEKQAPTSQSLAVNATALEEEFREDDEMDETVDGALDEMVYNAIADGSGASGPGDMPDGWDENTTASSEKKDATQSALPPLEPYAPATKDEHVVDHTPSELSFSGQRPSANDPSVAVLATIDDLTRDTGMGSNEEVYDDENEMAYVPVVDHTPGPLTVDFDPSSYNSIAAHAASVVEQGEDGTLFGDSTIAGGTLDGATLDGAGWDQEDPILEEEEDMLLADNAASVSGPNNEEETMVDHTPSEMGTVATVKMHDPSVAVLASIDENDNDSAAGTQYGLVVDHTPTTPAVGPRPNRSDSVVAQINDGDTVEDQTLIGGSTIGDADGSTVSGENDGDTFDDELPIGGIRSMEDNLVDRVPARPESRFGDASTIVAADASEMLSAVDDMEDGGFGPVVDQIPLGVPANQQPGVPSGAGSTVVFAPPSVATDDLDPDETAHGGDEWDHEDPIIEEDAPNPQSGNDEPVVNEQLVDFLPPPNEVPAPQADGGPSAAEASSLYAVGGAQSLVQPEDPREDDFGPVVDQTPTPRSSARQSATSGASTASLVTASEIGRMLKEDKVEGRSIDAESGDDSATAGSKPVVDHVPDIRGLRNIDSLATLGRSRLDDDEDEEETDSKFGPVVDHLPTPRTSTIGTSTVASRGGSTVDALGTVSEADSDGDDDDEEGDPWADDMDGSAASALTDRVSQAQSVPMGKGLFRRTSTGDGLSVKWDSTVRDSISDAAHNDTAYFETKANSTLSIDESQYFDATPGTPSGWAGARTDEPPISGNHGASFAEAETPPATPHQKPGTSIMPRGNNAPWLDLSALDSLSSPVDQRTRPCTPCSDSKDGECPCVKQLVDFTKEEGTMYGTLIHPSGKSIQVDFGKLLSDEMTKRRLVQEEAKALRELVEKQKREAAKDRHDSELASLRQANAELSNLVSRFKDESNRLQEENSRVLDELTNSDRLVQDLKEDKDRLRAQMEATLDQEAQKAEARAASFEQELTKLKNDMSASQNRASELQAQIEESKINGGKELASVEKKLKDLEEDLLVKCRLIDDLKEESTQQESTIEVLRAERSSAFNDVAELQRDNLALKGEVSTLMGELEISQKGMDQASADAEIIDMLKEEKLASAEACRELASEVDSLQKRITEQKDATEAETKSFKSEITNLESGLQEREGQISLLGAQLEESEAKYKALLLERIEWSQREAELTSALKHEQEYLQKSEAEKEDVLSRLDEAEKSLASVSEAKASLAEELKETARKSSTAKSDLEKKVISLTNTIEKLEQDMHSIQTEHKESMSNEHDKLKTKAIECDNLKLEMDKLRAQIVSTEEALSQITDEKNKYQSSADEKLRDALALTQQLQTQVALSESKLQTMKKTNTTEVDKLARKIEDLESVKASLEEKVAEQSVLFEESTQQQEKLKHAESQCQSLQEKLTALQVSLQKAEQSSAAAQRKLESLESERSAVHDQASKSTEELLSLRTKFSSSETALKAKDSEFQQMKIKLAIAEGKLKTAEQKLATATKQADRVKVLEAEKLVVESKMKQREADLGNQITSLRSQITESESLKQKMESELIASRSTADDLLNQIAELQSSHAKALSDTHAQISAGSENRISDLETTIRNLQSEVGARDRHILLLTQQAESLGEQLSEQASRFSTLEEAESSLQAERQRLLEASSQIQNLERSIEDFKSNLAQVNMQKTEAESQISNLHHENQNLHAVIQQKEEVALRLERELGSANERIQAMQVEGSSSNETINKLLSAKSQAEASLAHVRAEFNSLAQDAARKEETIQKLKHESTSLRQQLHSESSVKTEMTEADRMLRSSLTEAERMLQETSDQRDALVEENEELLVQLGLLKEEMDESDERFAQMDQELKNLEVVAGEYSVSFAQNGASVGSTSVVEKIHLALKSLQAKVGDLESALNSRDENEIATAERSNVDASTISNLEMRCKELESGQQSRDEEIALLRQYEECFQDAESRMVELQDQVLALEQESSKQKQLLGEKEAAVASAEARVTDMLKDDTSESLNRRIKYLEEEARSSRTLAHEWEAAYQSLQHQSTEHQQNSNTGQEAMKMEIQSLRSQLESTTASLESTQHLLAEKEEQMQAEIHELTSEVRSASRQAQSEYAIANNLSSDTDELKSQIISLALALERSESRRAEAMEYLQVERRTNAESLRRLGESVKRFYSSV